MLKKLSLMIAALAVSAACIGASSASAATLYTTAAHTTAVSVGSTFTMTIPATSSWQQYDKEGLLWQECKESSMTFKVTQNSGGVFKAGPTVEGPKWSKCAAMLPQEQVAGGFGTLQVSGSSISVGSNTDWLGTTLSGLKYLWPNIGTWEANFTSATGNPPAKGAYVEQPTTAKAPVSFALDRAGTTFNVNWGPHNVSAKYTFTGTAAAWSFG
jgi:hypothetical protein